VLAHFFVWLLVFTVPWQNMIVLPGIGTISSVLGMAAIAATILHVVMSGKVRSLAAFHWLATMYMAWIFLSAFWGIARQGSIQKEVNTYLQIFVMLWVVWEAAPTRRRLVNLLQAYVFGAYVAAGSTIHNYLTGVGIQEDAQRYSATGFDPNDLGVILALALPMAWYIASTTSSTMQRWANRLYLMAGVVGILLTGSRGALLAMIVALLVVPLTLTQVRRGVRVAAIVLAIAAAAVAVNFVPEKAFERLGTTGSEIQGGDLNSRLRIWKGGLATVPNAPFRGHGPGGWYPAVGLQIGNVAPHNTWLAILVEEGLIGLVLYMSMFAVIAAALLRLPTLERRNGLVQLATLMIGITPLSWHQHKAGWLTLALLAAWGAVLTAQQQPEEPLRAAPPIGRRTTRGAPVPI
jgi:O-antigen ligase